MEVGSKTFGVDKLNSCRFEVGPETIHVRHEVSKDSFLA
jgi:hypothetical protein